MGSCSPPAGNREHEEARAAVLEAVTALAGYEGAVRIPDIDVWLEQRATVMTHWHLLILGDHGLVESVLGPGDEGVRSHWRLRRDAA